MANYRLRHTYGHGAAKLPLAPVFAQSPFARPESFADSSGEALRQLRDAGPGRLAVRFVAIVGTTAACALGLSLLLAPLFAPPDDDPGQELVLVVNEPLDEEELLPEPPPVAPEPEPVLPEPEPEQVAVEPEPPPPVAPEPPPEPVKVVKRAPPPLPAMPKAVEPPPAEGIPTAAPVRVARAPVKRPPAVVSIDPLSPVPLAPSADPAPAPPPPTRSAARPPKASRPALPALADFAPIGDATAAPGEAAAVASRSVRTNVVARAGAPARPIAFAAVAPAAPPAAYDEDGETPALATRRAVPQKRAAATSAGPSARPMNMGFAAASASRAAVTDAASPASARSERAAVTARAASGATGENLAAVPLGSLAACATDREEDERKLDLLAAVKGRTECRSRAGRYRFVETKNLNAFLMWIERAPNRAAVDRCVELRLALECLGG